MKSESSTNSTNSFVEYYQLSKDYQQQILDLNLRQLTPAITKDNALSQVFTAAPGDRITINNLPSTSTHSSSQFCDKISIEVASTNPNSVTFKLTISNKTYEIEKLLTGKS